MDVSPAKLESHQVLGECLQLTDELIQTMAVIREMVSVDETAALVACDGDVLLHSCVEEMVPVARERGVLIRLDAKTGAIECNEAMFRRATFVLLDGMLAVLPRGGEVCLRLEEQDDCVSMKVRPGMCDGLRQKLCWKLMHAAGGSVTNCAEGGVVVLFRKASARQPLQDSLMDKRVLTSS